MKGILPLFLCVHSLQQQTGMVPKNKRGIQSDSLASLNSDSWHASLSTTSTELKREVGLSVPQQIYKGKKNSQTKRDLEALGFIESWSPTECHNPTKTWNYSPHLTCSLTELWEAAVLRPEIIWWSNRFKSKLYMPNAVREAMGTIFTVFGTTQPRIKPTTYQSRAHSTIRLLSWYFYLVIWFMQYTKKKQKETSTIPVVVLDQLVLLCRGLVGCRRVPPVLRDGRVSLHNHIEFKIFPLVHFHCQALVCQLGGELWQQPDVGLVCHETRSFTQCHCEPFFRVAGVASRLRLTDNQQVGRCAVFAGLIGANAGDVPSICHVHRGDGQNALDVQPIFSLGNSPLFHCYILRNR